MEIFKIFRSSQHRWAWAVALAADLIQLAGWPFFGEGGLSPADAVLDLAVAGLLTRILGWHWAFFPTFVVELVPGLDLFPTWTAAVFFVTRQRIRSHEPEILPPEK